LGLTLWWSSFIATVLLREQAELEKKRAIEEEKAKAEEKKRKHKEKRVGDVFF